MKIMFKNVKMNLIEGEREIWRIRERPTLYYRK